MLTTRDWIVVLVLTAGPLVALLAYVELERLRERRRRRRARPRGQTVDFTGLSRRTRL
jgi:hypothetical protein